MKIAKRIDQFFDWFIFERVERKILRKGIRKLCKKHLLNKLFLEMYLRIQKQVLDEVNLKEDQKGKLLDEEAYFCKSLFLGRIFEINLEFIQNMKKEFYHSANALTRQVIEIYHITALLNYNKDYRKTLLGKNNKRWPSFKDIRYILRKASFLREC